MRILLPFLAAFSSITLLLAQPAPVSIEVPTGAKLLLEAKGDGAQVYTCTDAHWVLKAPDAKLLDAQGQVIGTHFAGPTWRLSDGKLGWNGADGTLYPICSKFAICSFLKVGAVRI